MCCADHSAVLPQQTVEPRLVVGSGQEPAKAPKEILLLALAEIAIDPGLAHGGVGAVVPADGHQGGGVPDQSVGADRRVALEPRQDVPVRHGAGQLFLGPSAQISPRWPLGLALDEGDDRGEVGVGFRARVVEPADDLGDQRIAGRGGVLMGLLPLVLIDRREGGLGRLEVGVGKRGRRHGGEADEDGDDESAEEGGQPEGSKAWP